MTAVLYSGLKTWLENPPVFSGVELADMVIMILSTWLGQ
jgi:hypothetical protein